MVFSSFQFLLLFLPVVLIGTLAAQKFGDLAVKLWLIVASLAFYASWYPPYLAILLGSILANYAALRFALAQPPQSPARFWIVALGVAGNIFLLGWFKYAGFLALNINALFAAELIIPQFVLPLGISFFTFQKIALLVDVYRREVKDIPLLNYMMFVTFFPQLIAGPIVLYPEVQDQYREPGRIRLSLPHFTLGVSVFTVGLFKKAVIADLMGSYAAPIFGTAEAWTGVIAYTLQIYFDFSGYSDMAIGLAAMFGILLPFNFASPYRATSITEFWRRWHITLSRFLRVYLYVPLGGNRKGASRRYVNLLTVMLIGGLWHGAAWTFVVWGALHGAYLVINHLWRSAPLPPLFGGRIFAAASWFLTFSAVTIAWVFFRADSFTAATALLGRMFDPVGWSELLRNGYPATGILTATTLSQFHTTEIRAIPVILALGLAICLAMPNTQAFFSRKLQLGLAGHSDASPWRWEWRPSAGWAVVIGIMFAAAIMAITRGTSPFLYFNF
jgi:alginate O-acetyltransferase complex protein AlgI